MDLLIPYTVDSQTRLVLQKGSVTGREGASQPAQVHHCSFCWGGKPYVRKEKFLLKGIYFTFLQEVSYQLSSHCGAFILHHKIIKFKYIQPTNFKTGLKVKSLFFIPDKAVGRLLQRLIMVYKVFWLWEFDHSSKVLDDVSVKYSSVIKHDSFVPFSIQAIFDRNRKDELPRLQLEWIDSICMPLYEVIFTYCSCRVQRRLCLPL